MKSPIISSSPKFGMVAVHAWGAAPYIKNALRLRAEILVSCSAADIAPRTLMHGRVHRPESPWAGLWPLSIFAAHDVDYREYADDKMTRCTAGALYSKSQLDVAVARFLEGLPDDARVTINVMD